MASLLATWGWVRKQAAVNGLRATISAGSRALYHSTTPGGRCGATGSLSLMALIANGDPTVMKCATLAEVACSTLYATTVPSEWPITIERAGGSAAVTIASILLRKD